MPLRPTAPRGHGASRSAPTWLLLVVLTLVPTFGMGVLAWRQAGESAELEQRARRVAADAADLVHLMELMFALSQEHIPTQGLVQAARYGLDAEATSELVGFDMARRRETTRARTDAVVAGIGHGGDGMAILGDMPALVAGLRTLSDSTEVQAPEIQDAYMVVIDRADRATKLKLTDLLGSTDGLDARVGSALRELSTVISTFTASQRQAGALANAIFDPTSRETLYELAVSRSDFRRTREQLDASETDAPVSGWSDIRSRPEVARVDRAVSDALAEPGSIIDRGLATVADVYGDVFAQTDLFADLNQRAGDAAVSAAVAAESAASDAHRETILFSGTVAFLAFYLAFMVSWSISRPLHLLARRASLITEGQLAPPAATGGGPREVRIVAGALDEAAGNLRRVEEQAQALAVGDLDSEVLARPVAGLLGESVHASVEQLSDSLREQEKLRDRLAEQANTDILTGLLNRAGALAAAEHALARARRTGQQIAILFIDLDGFKRTNDAHGHPAGDAVLRLTADRLVATARAGDAIARIGGDEFVVIAEPVDDIGQAVGLGERLIAAVSEPIDIDGRTARIGASIGVAVNHDAHERALDLLSAADQAVVNAKRSGRGRVEVFDEVIRRELAERAEMEDALREGIARGELELHYQPVVDAASGRLHGFEALARWQRPGHGTVPPTVFVPVAEQCDLVIELGRWVLDEATRQLATWASEPALAGAHVSVNISGRHLLNAAIVDDVRSALERTGVAPERLILEITETVVLSDLGIAIRHLRDLRELGVRVALDDFGTGYTSIGQLGQLPIDILKIDQAFVAALHRDNDRTIVELMVEVAHTLGLGLVAEGVEELSQLHALQRLDCDDVQGFFIARPLRAGAVAAWAAGPLAGLVDEGSRRNGTFVAFSGDPLVEGA